MPALQQRGTRSELSPPARAPSPQPQQTPILRSMLQCGVDQRTQCVAYKTPHAPVSFQPMYVVLCSRRTVAARLASELPTEQAPVWAALYHIQHRCFIEHSRSSATIAVVAGSATRAAAGVKARHACLAPSWMSTDFSSDHHFQLQLPDARVLDDGVQNLRTTFPHQAPATTVEAPPAARSHAWLAYAPGFACAAAETAPRTPGPADPHSGAPTPTGSSHCGCGSCPTAS